MRNPETFYKKIREGEFANPDFPLQGVNALYPHGKALLNNLESLAAAIFSGISYEEVGLPEIVPKAFVSHLSQNSLFKAENAYRSFFLAGSAEMQSAFLAQEMVRGYRDLPLRFYSLSGARRENDSTSLIKDVEFRSLELNAFFASKEEALAELMAVNNAVAELLTNLGIPFVVVSQGKVLESPTVFLTRFLFSNTFGSLFWSNVVGTKYSDLLGFTFHGKDNRRHTPVQLNGGLTSRILSAYLAHHQDDIGFVLDPRHSPYQVLTSKLDEKTEGAGMLRIIQELRLRSKPVRGKRAEVMSKFTAMGTPLLAERGRNEISVTRRNDLQSQWATEDNLRELLVEQLQRQMTASGSASDIQIERLSQPLSMSEEYSPEKVYVIDRQHEEAIQVARLKRIGYLDDRQACYVCRKY